MRLGRQHVRDGIATIKTEKTGTIVTMPILPVLAETLAAGPCGDLSFIAASAANRWRNKVFSNEFARLAVLPAYRARHMACARSPRHGRPMPALQSPS